MECYAGICFRNKLFWLFCFSNQISACFVHECPVTRCDSNGKKSNCKVLVTAVQNAQLYEIVQNLEKRQEEQFLQLHDMLRHQGETIKQQQKEILKLHEDRRCENDRVQLQSQEPSGNHYNVTNVSGNNQEKRTIESVRSINSQPGSVAFSSFLDHHLEHLGIDHPIVYNRVLLNEGSGYISHSGMFTCPVDGMYVFYFSVSTNGIHQVVAKLVVDGINQVDAISDTYHSPQEAQGSNLVVLMLRKGQQVWIANYRWVDKSVQGSNASRFSTFSGFLLH